MIRCTMGRSGTGKDQGGFCTRWAPLQAGGDGGVSCLRLQAGMLILSRTNTWGLPKVGDMASSGRLHMGDDDSVMGAGSPALLSDLC